MPKNVIVPQYATALRRTRKTRKRSFIFYMGSLSLSSNQRKSIGQVKTKAIIFPLMYVYIFNVNKMLLSKGLIFIVPRTGSEVKKKKKKSITKASKQCKQH